MYNSKQPTKYFDSTRNRLVFIRTKATADFWDDLWSTEDLRKDIQKGAHDRFITKNTRKFLQPSSDIRILEGGCGKGQFVYALSEANYQAYGIDFAPKTVAKIHEAMPDLKITLGDVRKTEFPDDFFDGYWSIGVIEHFYQGYAETIREMARITKPGGYLFLTFPYLSPLRKLKALVGCYPLFKEKAVDLNNFYQFALDHVGVTKDLENIGFSLVYKKPFDGIKGFKDEAGPLQPLLQRIYNHPSFIAKLFTSALSFLLSPVSSHSILLVLKKKK